MTKIELVEMLAHVPLSTHKEPQHIFLVSDQVENYLEQFSKYQFLEFDIEVSLIEDFDGRIAEFENGVFDIAIIDQKLNNIQIAHISRVLKKDGLVAMVGESFETLKNLAKNFRIAMPYLVFMKDNFSEILYFGSKFYHPTADINLQRSDLLEDLNYYNSDIHVSAFYMPNYIKNEIANFVRN